MAQFIAKIRGSREDFVDRLGTKNSGAIAIVQGYAYGVTVRAVFDKSTETEIFKIYLNCGSNNNQLKEEIGHVVNGQFEYIGHEL